MIRVTVMVTVSPLTTAQPASSHAVLVLEKAALTETVLLKLSNEIPET